MFDILEERLPQIRGLCGVGSGRWRSSAGLIRSDLLRTNHSAEYGHGMTTVYRGEKKSIQHHRGTPRFSVCRPTPGSRSKKSCGVDHFPGKTREKGTHHKSGKKCIRWWCILFLPWSKAFLETNSDEKWPPQRPWESIMHCKMVTDRHKSI